MQGEYRRVAVGIGVLLLWMQGAGAVVLGQPLGSALEELRSAGLQLIFSTALIEPTFSVTVAPGEGSPEQVARRILAPYGLTLNAIRPGLFTVVRQPADAALPAAEAA